VMNADGTGVRQLTSGKTNDTHPTWSPDGKSIAFVRDEDIYVMGADGAGPKRISDIDAQESDPAWSPDGDWFAYIKRTPGTPVQNLWLMRPDGSERHALTRQSGRAFTPAWSPDSKRIVFSMNRNQDQGLFELFTIGVDGKALRSVVGTTHDNFEPAWSPDGSEIAYQEEGAIFTIELGGGDKVKRLTENSTNDSSPAWNPKLASDQG
jgi:Tol biopolymer transport system component